MKIDFGFMEIVAKPANSNFDNISLDDLTKAMYQSQIHTFGWPIAPVIFSEEYKPRPISGGIEAKISAPGHRDYWTLRRTGEFYFIGELFENNRNPDYIFIDTRTNRITESFLRVGSLYSALGIPNEEKIFFLIRHGNINGKILGAANTSRVFPIVRRSNVSEVKSEFSSSLSELMSPEHLKNNVYKAVRDIGEMFDMFNPDKASFTDPIVDAFKLGRII